MAAVFAFLDAGDLSDGEIRLTLDRTLPADDAKGYVPAYLFAIRACDTGDRAGEISLRVGYNQNIRYGGHIGYGVLPAFRGRRYAARACRLIFSLARRHGMERLLITCNPENTPSRRTCELVGGRLLEIVDLPPDNEMYRAGERRKCIYAVVL